MLQVSQVVYFCSVKIFPGYRFHSSCLEYLFFFNFHSFNHIWQFSNVNVIAMTKYPMPSIVKIFPGYRFHSSCLEYLFFFNFHSFNHIWQFSNVNVVAMTKYPMPSIYIVAALATIFRFVRCRH